MPDSDVIIKETGEEKSMRLSISRFEVALSDISMETSKFVKSIFSGSFWDIIPFSSFIVFNALFIDMS